MRILGKIAVAAILAWARSEAFVDNKIVQVGGGKPGEGDGRGEGEVQGERDA